MMRLLKIVAMLLLAVPLAAQSDPKALIESGRRLLDDGNATDAIETMKRAVAAAGDEKNVAATAHFYLGLGYDMLRDRANTKDEIARLSEAAIDAYSRSIGEKPSASAMNNLAQIRAAKGDHAKALELLRKAVALNDKQKEYYEENLGDLLLLTGKAADATEQYLRASMGRLGGSRLNEKVTAALVKWAESDDLTPGSSAKAAREYVARLYADNLIDATVQTSLDLISRSERLDAQAGRELMALAAAALSKRNYEAATFAGTPPAKQLTDIAKTRQVTGAGAKQLLALYQAPRPESFFFWRTSQSPAREGPSPLEAFRLVARSIGFQKQQAGDVEAAEAYYRAALVLGDYEIDSRAFLDLATLYFTTGRRADLERVAEEFDSQLYRGKGLAYQRLDWDGVYEYHRTLGSVYRWLEQWTNPSRPFASAIYQLEHAQKAVDEINRRPHLQKKTIDPILNVYLAEAYSATNQPQRAFEAQLDAADGFVKIKDYLSAQEVLLESEKVPKQYLAEYNSRYKQLLLAAHDHKVIPVPGPRDDVPPVNAQAWLDDFTIGSELGGDGTIVTGKTGDDFVPGQPIYISMEVGDAPPNSTVKVVWYGPGGTKIGEENQAVVAGRKYLAFNITDTARWVEGYYRLETWIGDEKVNTQQFNITHPANVWK
jgi:tetratricopeptide (TPR) repeat protein